MKAKDRHTERLEIVLTPSERKLLEQAAEGKLATWARKVLLKEAKRKN